jgi:hypothetical protein
MIETVDGVAVPQEGMGGGYSIHASLPEQRAGECGKMMVIDPLTPAATP